MDGEKPRLLVTGASGFVGEVVACHFVALGWGVTALGGANLPEIRGATNRSIDLLDFPAVAELMQELEPHFVIHAAGATSISACRDDPTASGALNVEATRHLLHQTTGVFLFTSTDLVFDGSGAPYSESDAPKPLHEYGSQKWTAEQVVLDSPRGIVVRLPLVLGQPGEWGKSALSWMVETLRQGKTLNLFHDEWRTPVWVEDVARACEVVLAGRRDNPNGPAIFHAAGAERLNRLEMGEMTCHAFGLDRDLIAPLSRLDIPGGHLRARDVSMRNDHLAAMGWNPTPMDEAFTKCAANWPAQHQ